MASPIQFASAETKAKVISNCWEYLFENFHKFNESNKIKITLAIICRDMPTKLEGDVKGPQQIVVIRSKEELDTIKTLPRQISVQQ
jgi:hypothetical protein